MKLEKVNFLFKHTYFYSSQRTKKLSTKTRKVLFNRPDRKIGQHDAACIDFAPNSCEYIELN